MANPYSGYTNATTVMGNVRSGAGTASVNGSPTGPAPTPDSPEVDALANASAAMSARAVLGRLAPYLRPVRGLLALAIVASVATTLLQLYAPVIIGEAIDLMIGPRQVNMLALVRPLQALAAVTLGASATQWLSGYATTRLAYELALALRVEAYDRLATLPLSLVDAHAHGDLLARITVDVDTVGDGILQGLTQLLTGIVAIVGTLVFMVGISVRITIWVVVLTPLSILAAWAIAHFSATSFAAQQALTGRLAGLAEEMIGSQHLVAVFGHERAAVEEFDAINAELYVAGEHAQFVSALANPSTRLVNGFVYAVVAVLGCLQAITGVPTPLTVGEVQSLLSYANKYMVPFNQVSGVVTQVQAAFASARRVFALLDAEPEPSDVPALATLAEPRGELDFDHVAFSYDGVHPLLRDISFHVNPGQKFALVGETGCGKTTLINLLLRFYEPDSGAIRVDGVDVAGLTRENLRSAFGMVLQDTWLFAGTVRANIAYGRPDASLEDVRRAARKAHADKFIRQLPDGYDTYLPEDGGSLSAGQRQLLCIARVMLADPPILLLDEATSSIDTRTEREVADAFDRMMLGRTSLVVAHRLSTVRTADRILVMSGGVIAEAGSHDELLARGGLYASLYNSQFER